MVTAPRRGWSKGRRRIQSVAAIAATRTTVVSATARTCRRGTNDREGSMKVNGLAKDFIIVGENIHTTRVVLRNGKRVATIAAGAEAVVYTCSEGTTRHLVIPEEIKRSQDYEEGRVKHVKIAVNAAMSGREPEASEGLEYLRSLVRRQERTGADFLDLNVDEISLRPAEQKNAMQWLVRTVQGMTSLPVSIDSSNIEIIQKGMEACDTKCRPASPELGFSGAPGGTRPGPTTQQSCHRYCGWGKRHASK